MSFFARDLLGNQAGGAYISIGSCVVPLFAVLSEQTYTLPTTVRTELARRMAGSTVFKNGLLSHEENANFTAAPKWTGGLEGRHCNKQT